MTQSGSSASFSGSGLDSILNFKADDQDLYQLVGCDSSSSVEQIRAEYKVRARCLHPDKNPGDDRAEQRFQQLQFAKDTLCDEQRRATYDKWRRSGLAMNFRDWLGMGERVHTSMHWATPKTAGRMLPATSRLADESTVGGSTAGESIRWGRSDGVGWIRSEGGDLIKKFRNYEI